MAMSDDTSLNLPGWLDALRTRTPARLLAGRAGSSYRTAAHLQLRQDHAAARDAVEEELDLQRDLGPLLMSDYRCFEVHTRAFDKRQFLLRPDLGRQLDPLSREAILARCPRNADLQIIIGDGLSVAAVRAQVAGLFPHLVEGARARGWTVGQPFVVRYCRVGILNDLGELLEPQVIVLLIGERPGLATAESLSAYLAYRPRPGDTDERRNLISNIHARGVCHEEAAHRILALAAKMMDGQQSGVTIKEDLAALADSRVIRRDAE